MTWTKLSDDFADELAGLSDAAFRTHVEGLLWVMRRETGGHLTERDVRRFAETDEPTAAVQELLDQGVWQGANTGYAIRHHMEHQPDREVLAARRANDAQRQAKKRRKDAGLSQPESRPESRRDTTCDDPRDPGRVGSGRVGPTNQGSKTTKSQEPHVRTHERTHRCMGCGDAMEPGQSMHPDCEPEARARALSERKSDASTGVTTPAAWPVVAGGACYRCGGVIGTNREAYSTVCAACDAAGLARAAGGDA